MDKSNSTFIINPDVDGDPIIMSLALLFTVFLFGAVIQFVTHLVKIGLPYTVVVFMLGMLMGLAREQQIKVGPHLLLNTFMPILIFEGAFAMDVFVLRKVFWQALFMAGPGLVVITGLTAIVAQPLMRNKDWGWKESLLFGSILSATDPVAVVALLKELGASPFLSLFIEGESLLNDGTAMVAFVVLYKVITGEEELSAEYVIIGGFLRFAVGGPLFGYFMARVCLFWLSKTFNDPLSEIAATLVAAFLTFYASENFIHVSGVLALVVLGVVLSNNRTSISPEVETFLHSFWEILAYLANTLIFFLVGVIVMELIATKKWNAWDFVYLFLIYVSINSISISIFLIYISVYIFLIYITIYIFLYIRIYISIYIFLIYITIYISVSLSFSSTSVSTSFSSTSVSTSFSSTSVSTASSSTSMSTSSSSTSLSTSQYLYLSHLHQCLHLPHLHHYLHLSISIFLIYISVYILLIHISIYIFLIYISVYIFLYISV
ncbi:hypothetical protein ACOMHN_008456 [Nucella lapillus]